ncbi:MAG: TonB-dependent receptor [Prevotella sp.]|nr:TonB-dependent receptor [Prevotella sp.]
MRLSLWRPLFLLLACLSACRLQAQQSRFDSVQHVAEVVVLQQLTYREVIPSQVLKGDALHRVASLSVADALRYFSGVQLKDYGGVGGLKTVNVRSMGSHHVGVYYDGIELGNAQNGVVDLGQFSLDNVEEVSLYNGQKSAIFQPAAEFGNAGSVYIRTRRPKFQEGEHRHLRFTVKGASADTWRVAGLWEERLNDHLFSSLNAEALTSSGRYEFRYRRKNQDGTVAYDTTATRHNGDIQALRMEANLHGLFDQGGWHLKGYTYHSHRGIPGAIVSNVWRRGERQADHNSFLQASAQKAWNPQFSSRWLAKYAYYSTHYVNNDYTTQRVDNLYHQQEAYFSTSNVYEMLPGWSASASYDFRFNTLRADIPRFAFPHRFSNQLSVATAYNHPLFSVQASLLGTSVKDHTRTLADKPSVQTLTPAFFVNCSPLGDVPFTLRAYAKKSFRMPTFNDLFYTNVGNAMLKPESAIQYNVGATFEWGGLRQFRNTGRMSGGVQGKVSLDAYYNTVHDKIVAYPKGQQFRWTMLNLGCVHIKGVDAEAQVILPIIRNWGLNVRAQYTYQDARDVTDARDTYYNDQIPYVPWHSGSVIVGLTHKRWTIDYSFIYVGERYNQQENTKYNYMQPWYTNDLHASYSFQWGDVRCRLTGEVNNLLSQDYDVILNYPMPKRNYALALSVEL